MFPDQQQGVPHTVLTPTQRSVVALPASGAARLFCHGRAGSGKTTALQSRLAALLAAGITSSSIVTLLAEPGATDGYLAALSAAELGPYSDLHLTTFVGMARELVDLFWPLIAGLGGFKEPLRPPVFLSYDLAQVLMQQIVQPLLQEGHWEGLRLRPQQILSQLLDNLNRAALNGISLDEMENRMVNTWGGDPRHLVHLSHAADAARRFRHRCVASNTLDLSLVVDIFQHQLLRHPQFQDYLRKHFRHLLVDNLAEMPPAGLAFVQALLAGCESAVLAYDEGGGYRRYLAADPKGGWALGSACNQIMATADSFTTTASMSALAASVRQQVMGQANLDQGGAADAIMATIKPRHRRDMVGDVVSLVARLALGHTHDSGPAVAIITPYLDAALYFGLTNGLAAAGLPHRLLRRRASPRDEPLIKAWLTLAMLANPRWGVRPTEYDVAEALALTIDGLDRPRAALAARHLFDSEQGQLRLTTALSQADRTRIGDHQATLLDRLAAWMAECGGPEPLDRFLGHLFDDLLRTRGFWPEGDLEAAARFDWLIRTATRFRFAAPAMGLIETAEQARVFIESTSQGMVTGVPLPEPSQRQQDCRVLIATLYAYLLTGPAVDYQIWLEAGATGWWQIPRQPLSNAFVFSPHWAADRRWTVADSYAVRNELLSRVVGGLCDRCRQAVVVASSEFDRRGQRQDGPLWRAVTAPR